MRSGSDRSRMDPQQVRIPALFLLYFVNLLKTVRFAQVSASFTQNHAKNVQNQHTKCTRFFPDAQNFARVGGIKKFSIYFSEKKKNQSFHFDSILISINIHELPIV